MSYKTMNNCLKFSSSVVFLLFFQAATAQSDLSQLDNIVDAKQKLLKTDVVLVVANKDTVVYQKDSKAFSALRGQAPIGAASQWLTAALAMVAVDEGKISLDDKVSGYLPVFSSYMKNYVTIRHCLSHFTGIQAEPPAKALKLFEKKKFESLDEEVKAYASKHIENNAGEVFRYSNIGPAIAARILEIVYKKRFDMLAQQKLFRPMGMRQTTFTTLDGSPPDAADGARSSAGDLIRFLTMLLNKGMYKGQKVLSEEGVAELRKIQTAPERIKYTPDVTKGYAFALGAWVPEQNGNEATELVAPSFGGTLPVVNFSKGYAYVFFVKDQNDQKNKIYEEMKEVLDTTSGPSATSPEEEGTANRK